MKKRLSGGAAARCRAREIRAAFPDDEDEQCLGSCDLEDGITWGLYLFITRGASVRVWFGLLALGGVKGHSGLCCFPLRALCFGLGSVGLPGAFGRTAGGGGRGRRLRADARILAVGSLQLLVLQTAQLPCGRPRAQRPLVVSLAEGVWAELTESVRVFPADVTMVPGAVPASCRCSEERDT